MFEPTNILCKCPARADAPSLAEQQPDIENKIRLWVTCPEILRSISVFVYALITYEYTNHTNVLNNTCEDSSIYTIARQMIVNRDDISLSHINQIAQNDQTCGFKTRSTLVELFSRFKFIKRKRGGGKTSLNQRKSSLRAPS